MFSEKSPDGTGSTRDGLKSPLGFLMAFINAPAPYGKSQASSVGMGAAGFSSTIERINL